MNMEGKTILLVEDNPKVMRNNRNLLRSKGALVLTAGGIKKARTYFDPLRFESQRIDAAVIDIMLPDGSGLELLQEIRSDKRSSLAALPVLLLTAKSQSNDIVNGLSAGADDYLAKPYDLDVFAARIEALLRRTAMQGNAGMQSTPGAAPAAVSNSIIIGRLRFDMITNQAFYSDKDMLLSKKEFALLFVLAQNKGKTLSAQYLYEKVWKQPFAKDNYLIKSHISNLKKKLAVLAADVLIESSWGEGYCLYNP